MLLDGNYFAALIVAAIGTDRVRQAHRTAVRAGHQVARFQSIVRATTIAAAFGMFALGLWGHFVLLIDMQPPGAEPGVISRRMPGL